MPFAKKNKRLKEWSELFAKGGNETRKLNDEERTSRFQQGGEKGILGPPQRGGKSGLPHKRPPGLSCPISLSSETMEGQRPIVLKIPSRTDEKDSGSERWVTVRWKNQSGSVKRTRGGGRFDHKTTTRRGDVVRISPRRRGKATQTRTGHSKDENLGATRAKGKRVGWLENI